MESRRLNFIIFFVSLVIMIGLNVLNSIYHFPPCPLCQVQHMLLALITFNYLLAYFQNPPIRGIRCYGAITCIFSMLGMLLAGRQWWLYTHAQVLSMASSCGSDIFYLLKAFSLREVISMMWFSYGGCEQTKVMLFHVPLPAWAFISFGFFSIIGIVEVIYPKNKKGG